jgi:uncharacterized RDD family membrane protein YckC
VAGDPRFASSFAISQARRGPAPGVAYVGFWLRLVARIIDTMVALVVPTIVFSVALALVDSNCVTTAGTVPGTVVRTCTVSSAVGGIVLALWFAVPTVYFPLMWAHGGTLGHRALGLRVLDTRTGQAITVSQAIGRYFGAALGVLCVWLGVIWIAFDPRKQGWHDKIAGTVVVRQL